MSKSPPSKEMEKVDGNQIEYAEEPSDVEDQNEAEEQDKVNILEDLDCSSIKLSKC